MTINLTDTAAALVKADIAAFKRDGKRYAEYVTEMNVTHDTLAEHVKIFREAFKAACPKATGDQIKAYATKVRNGLRYHLAPVQVDEVDPDYLAAVLKAVDKGVDNGLDAAAIHRAVSDHLESLLS